MVELADNGTLRLNLHEGQTKAWDSDVRYTAVIAGSQSGKTVIGPWWLEREIRRCGPGDYMVVAPSFQLMEKKVLPTFREVFEQYLGLGRYKGSPTRQFVYSQQAIANLAASAEQYPAWAKPGPVNVFFGHAQDAEGLESATAKAAWLDEPGQKTFKLDSWQAIQRRLRIYKGRVLFTTTPYDLGWLEQQVYDRYKAGDPNYMVVNFSSPMNPLFDMAEYEAARDEMPLWKFRMMYDGIFTQPAGLIYDCYDERQHVVEPFDIPAGWKRYMGLDFGGTNTAGVHLANEQGTNNFYIYREYLTGGKTAAEHAHDLLRGEPGLPQAYGGSKGEHQWRREFRDAGLPVRLARVSNAASTGVQGIVEVGISRVYGALKRGNLYVFSNLHKLREEFGTYSRKLDEYGEPLEDIEDKEKYHLLDATRYVVSEVAGKQRAKVRSKKAEVPAGGLMGDGYGMDYEVVRG